MTFDIRKTSVPAKPGVYIMHDDSNNIIYIGKAKNLKNRVKSYFGTVHDIKTQRLVEKINDIEFVITDTEADAYLLESSLIKQHRPRYNIELKDQQRYTYLRITDEKYPRLTVARRTRNGKFIGKGKFYGPFTRGSSKLLTIGSLRKAFKIRICKTLPKKACLEYHLGNCDAPCEFASAQEPYARNVKNLQLVLGGGEPAKKFASKLHDEMEDAASSLEFERAIGIRDTLERLGTLREKSNIERMGNAPDEDYVGVLYAQGTQDALVMTIKQVRGVIRDTERFRFELMADNTISNFVYQYYTTRDIPRYVVMNEMPQRAHTLEAMLASACGHDVSITVPKRGKRRNMIHMILRNLEVARKLDSEPGIYEIQSALGIHDVPRVIECFDISNHGDDYAVGSMSRLVDGEPDKAGYRKFRIRTVKGRDDYAMMYEVISRRYSRLLSAPKELPDLILVDGGKGQLRSALRALGDIGVRVACASLAKRNEEIFVPRSTSPITLPKSSSALQILQRARDEAHRFGVSYNRTLRRKILED